MRMRKYHQYLIGSVTLLALIYYDLCMKPEPSRPERLCSQDLRSGAVKCRPVCQLGYFSFPGMDSCHRWLGCAEINTDITKLEQIALGMGSVKVIYRGLWKGHNVTLQHQNPKRPTIIPYYQRGIDNLRRLQPSKYVVQFIGSCGLTFVTQFHPLGSPDNLAAILKSPEYKIHNNVNTRLKVCISYANVLNFLHTSPMGTRVLCDTESLGKTISQFLLTDDLNLVVNDLDFIPEANRKGGLLTTCGVPGGKFCAPEQFWPFNDTQYTLFRVPGYDEKADIWKMPDVCKYFLSSYFHHVKHHLDAINSRCKEKTPSLRPSADEVTSAYEQALTLLNYNIPEQNTT